MDSVVTSLPDSVQGGGGECGQCRGPDPKPDEHLLRPASVPHLHCVRPQHRGGAAQAGASLCRHGTSTGG